LFQILPALAFTIKNVIEAYEINAEALAWALCKDEKLGLLFGH